MAATVREGAPAAASRLRALLAWGDGLALAQAGIRHDGRRGAELGAEIVGDLLGHYVCVPGDADAHEAFSGPVSSRFSPIADSAKSCVNGSRPVACA